MENASLIIQLVFVAIVVLSVASLTLILSRRFKIPFAVCLVIAGMIGAQISQHGPETFHAFDGLSVSHDFIFFVLMPTLVFESAYGLDAWQLKRNWLPILTLAFPGILLSTFFIAAFLKAFGVLAFLPALLLGAVLSAIDHVSVSSLFKQLGAPKRLIILVEGESLFSDVSLIVLAYVLLDVVKADYVTGQTAIYGVLTFFKVLLGGIGIGLVCGFLTGFILGRVVNNPMVEISLVMMLAYLSFFIAEYGFHVSGVMATAVTGLMMSGWGKTKISHTVHQYLDEVWEFLAFISIAVVFLLVGYVVDLVKLFEVMHLLVWVVVAILLARAVVVFGLMPVVGKLPNSEPVNWRYQAAMYWGGIRGAVALALTMSLGNFEYSETFLAVVTGVVLFTLLVPGLTLNHLMHYLGLDKPALADRFSELEGMLSAKQHALARVPDLRVGGLFSARIAKELEGEYQAGIQASRNAIEVLRRRELNAEKEVNLLFFRCLSEQKTYYYEMFSHAHLSEQAFRYLNYSIDLQVDALRYKNKLPEISQQVSFVKQHDKIDHIIAEIPLLNVLLEKVHTSQTVQDFEKVWARQQATVHVLNNLDKMDTYCSRPESLRQVREHYQQWNTLAKQHFDQMAEQFPEFVNAMQLRLAQRLFLHAESESITRNMTGGTLSQPLAEKMLHKLEHEIHHLRGQEKHQLKVESEELLKKVPFFKTITEQDFELISKYLRSVTVPAGSVIFKQWDNSHALYLIARGVVRVSITIEDKEIDVATMMAGDFFGEMALLHGIPRTATCTAVSPCALYRLNKKDFDSIKNTCPSIESALRETDQKRFEELQQLKT